MVESWSAVWGEIDKEILVKPAHKANWLCYGKPTSANEPIQLPANWDILCKTYWEKTDDF